MNLEENAKSFEAWRTIERLMPPDLLQCPKCEKIVDACVMELIPNYGLMCPKCVKENE